MTIVNIGKKVKFKDLERALIGAALEVGLNIKSEDKFKTEYELGSVREVSKYDETVFYLSGSVLPAMQVTTDNRREQDYFFLHSGFGFGVASEGKVKAYLDAVSRHL